MLERSEPSYKLIARTTLAACIFISGAWIPCAANNMNTTTNTTSTTNSPTTTTNTPTTTPPDGSGTVTVTIPAIAGSPGDFKATTSIVAPQQTTPAVDFNNLTATMDGIEKGIRSSQQRLDNTSSAAEQLAIKQGLDALLEQQNKLRILIDAANLAANAVAPSVPPSPPPATRPSPAPSPKPTTPKNIDNNDIALWADLLNKKKNKFDPKDQQKVKTAADAIDLGNKAKDMGNSAKDLLNDAQKTLQNLTGGK